MWRMIASSSGSAIVTSLSSHVRDSSTMSSSARTRVRSNSIVMRCPSRPTTVAPGWRISMSAHASVRSAVRTRFAPYRSLIDSMLPS
jgi:hypothetical protein